MLSCRPYAERIQGRLLNPILASHRILWRCLRPQSSPSEPAALKRELAADGIRWDQVVRIAEQEMLSAALYGALIAGGLIDAVPQPVRDPLKRRFTINLIRNEKIKQQAADIVATLNQCGIEPIILKGGLHFFEAPPAEIGNRMMWDLDFLVPEEAFEQAITALRATGYAPDDEGESWIYHYRPMSQPGSIAPIDVHKYVGEQKDILPTAEAWRLAVPVAAGELRLRALCPSHRVIHNVFHSQVQDRGHELGIIYPRQLHALAEICLRHGPVIDWEAVRERMERHGLGPVLRARMYQAHRIFGVPLPRQLAPTLGARVHHRRCLGQLRWGWLMRLMQEWAGATQPFKRRAIVLMYACSDDPLTVNAYRARHAWHLLRKHRGQIRRKMIQKRASYE